MLKKAINKFIKKKPKKVIKKTVEKTTMLIDDKPFSIVIHRERRNNTRFSLGKQNGIMRMPLNLSLVEQEARRKEFEAWMRNLFNKKNDLKKRYLRDRYQTGDVLKVGSREYILRIENTSNRRHSAKLKGQEILLKINPDDNEQHLQKAIKRMLSRVVAQDFLPEMTQRVLDFNDRFFQKNIRSVKLTYTQHWGRCSATTDIKLSTRLLFAPPAVIDYVIVHELAHLIEMNHSRRFWALVEKAMPNYKELDNWLKINGHSCDF